MTQPARPSEDGNRPRIVRTTSLFPSSGRRSSDLERSVLNSLPDASFSGRSGSGTYGSRRSGSGTYSTSQASFEEASGEYFIPLTGTTAAQGRGPGGSQRIREATPEGYEVTRVVSGGFYVRPRDVPPYTRPTPDRAEPPTTGGFYQQAVSRHLQSTISQRSTQSITATGDAASSPSIVGPLDISGVDPNLTFLFDRGPVIDPETGDRTGVLQSRGVYGSADSLERQLPAGETIKTGVNENFLTIQAGVLWLRNLAARDPDAYNRLVVLLRNAGYGDLPANDAALPLNGYTQQVGVAFALAANDLSAANDSGDTRTLLEYLTTRGQGYADYLAQQEADQAAADAYQPIDRQYQDPATLKSAAKAAAVEALGRKLTDEEEARFEAFFRSQENTLYDAIDAAGEAKTSFSGYAPDVGGQVDAFIDGPEFDTERASNSIGEYAQVFQRMMGIG